MSSRVTFEFTRDEQSVDSDIIVPLTNIALSLDDADDLTADQLALLFQDFLTAIGYASYKVELKS